MADERSDFELLDGWRAGDAAAGNALFRRHFGPICRFFRNKVGEGVEDLIQRTFLACVESRDAFRKEASFRTYLFTVARHELYAHLRRGHRHEAFDSQAVPASAIGPSATEVLARKREQRQLLLALREIPLDFQIALELYFWEDMPAPDLARVLGIPVGTVRGRIRRGKALLEQRLEAGVHEGESVKSTVQRLEDWARSLKACVDADLEARGHPPKPG